MGQAAELNIELELKRREEEQRDLQVERDIKVLRQREEEYEAGRSRLVSFDELWSSLEKAGL